MSKKIIISGYYGFKNFGDEAILSVLINKLNEYNHKLCVISANPEYTKSLYPEINSVKTFDFLSIIKSIYSSEILISGGGSLLQDVTSIKSLFYYLLIISCALLLRKKVLIFAQGIGPIKNKIGQIMTKLVLKHCSYISVRDKKSAELLYSWGINSEILCDPIFSTKVTRAEKNKVFGIQLRDCHGISDKFLENLANFIINNFSDFAIEIYSLQDTVDYEICKKFYNLLNEKCRVTLNYNMKYNDFMKHISACEYLISMRFHGIIAGLLYGVKTIAINYDIKVGTLAKEFDIPMLEFNSTFDTLLPQLKQISTDKIDNKLIEKKFSWDSLISNIKN